MAIIEENKRLKRDLKVAQEERDILKKATAYFAKHSSSSTPLLKSIKQLFSITRMCRVLDVKPSSYYDWMSRHISEQ